MGRQVPHIPGAGFLDLMPKDDPRGSFTRLYCSCEHPNQENGFELKQINLSRNLSTGTLRGFHFQTSPHEETKIISLMSGSLYSVIIDLRRESETFERWASYTLSSDLSRQLMIPAGCANAFLTLEENTTLLYFMSHDYHADSARGLRYNDPFFEVEWPQEPKVISERDLSFSLYLSNS